MPDCVSSLAFVSFGPNYRPTLRRRSSDRQAPQGRSIGPNALCRQHREPQCQAGVDPPCFTSQSFTGPDVARSSRPNSDRSADAESAGAGQRAGQSQH